MVLLIFVSVLCKYSITYHTHHFIGGLLGVLQKNTNTKHANVKVTKNNGSGSDAVHAAKSRGMYGDTMAITYQTERGGTILYIIKWKKLKK